MYLAALKDIAEAEVSTQEEVFAMVLLVVAPDATRAVVQRADRWMRDHQKRLVTAVAGGVGIYLTGKGLVALSG
jgi:hypothetical protein